MGNISTLIHGNALEVLKTLPEQSVHCIVTSSPYYGLRDYGAKGQIGAEQTLPEFVDNIVAVMDECRRVLRGDGLLFLNIGDSYSQSEIRNRNGTGKNTSISERSTLINETGRKLDYGLPPKSLTGTPYRVALAMQDEGWILRSDIIWHVTNKRPESVKDRPSQAHEHIFMFAKSRHYYYDWYAVMEDATHGGYEKRNMRNVWTIGNHPTHEEHYAAFPPLIPQRCIAAATSAHGVCSDCGRPYKRRVTRQNKRILHAPEHENIHSTRGGGMDRSKHSPPPVWIVEGWVKQCKCSTEEVVPAVVLDPFVGSGTTSFVATEMGRHSIGIDLNPEYIEITRRRLQNAQLPMFVE